MTKSRSRFPFTSSPKGWFCVGLSRDLPVGGVLPVKAFEKDLVVFRGEDGKAVVLGAYCPHMGAHLGCGGTVVGNQLKCPFHAWEFNGAGKCTKIPYAGHIPPKASVRKWELVEKNGLLMVWNNIEGGAPEWELPEVPEVGSPDWTEFTVREWDIKTHSFEMAENQVDVAHFQYLHGTLNYPASVAEEAGHILKVTSKADMGTSRGTTQGGIQSTSWGFGFQTIRFSGIVDTLLIAAVTPTDAESVHVRFCFQVKKTAAGDELTRGVGKAFIGEVSRQLEQDIPVWENKVFVHPPMLCEGDGPIPLYRRWLRQFFPVGTFDGMNLTSEQYNA